MRDPLSEFLGIPIVISPITLSVFLFEMPSTLLGYNTTRPTLIGSMSAFNEWIAVNIAAAYRPEGVQ